MIFRMTVRLSIKSALNVSSISYDQLSVLLHPYNLVISASQVAPAVKNPPARAGDARDVGSIPGLGRSLEEEMETQSSILAWRILWTEELGRLHTVHGSIYCHSAYLTYMQSISSEMLGWMTQKLEPRLLGEISTTSNM